MHKLGGRWQFPFRGCHSSVSGCISQCFCCQLSTNDGMEPATVKDPRKPNRRELHSSRKFRRIPYCPFPGNSPPIPAGAAAPAARNMGEHAMPKAVVPASRFCNRDKGAERSFLSPAQVPPWQWGNSLPETHAIIAVSPGNVQMLYSFKAFKFLIIYTEFLMPFASGPTPLPSVLRKGPGSRPRRRIRQWVNRKCPIATAAILLHRRCDGKSVLAQAGPKH